MASLDQTSSKSLSLIQDGWFYEKNEAWNKRCQGYKVDRIVAYKQSKFQEILLFDSGEARVLVLDGVVQFDTEYEHTYHEMMVHVPCFAHPDPQSVLVLGGGDGGCVRELLKHDGIRRIVWVEIDADVVRLTREYCPSIHGSGIYSDGRVSLLIDDGIKYVEKCKDETFDVIIVDGSDPIGTSPSASLFTTAFYEHCHRVLKQGGVINSQNECMWDMTEKDSGTKAVILKSMRDSVRIHGRGDVRYCSMLTPMYIQGQLGSVVARKYCPQMIQKYGSCAVNRMYRDIPPALQKTLKHYSSQVHSASFVIPYQIDSMLRSNL